MKACQVIDSVYSPLLGEQEGYKSISTNVWVFLLGNVRLKGLEPLSKAAAAEADDSTMTALM
jgi:hypothetical protein